jgi:hypothetical protein
MSAHKIDKKIVGYHVAKPEDKAPPKPRVEEGTEGKVIRMHEKLERPDMLIGATYKIKPPVAEHAMYVTINDILLNAGTSTRRAGRSRSSSTRRTSITTSGSWR